MQSQTEIRAIAASLRRALWEIEAVLAKIEPTAAAGTTTDDKLLQAMQANPDGRHVDWAEAAGFGSKGTVTKVLDRLARRGLVEQVNGKKWRVARFG